MPLFHSETLSGLVFFFLFSPFEVVLLFCKLWCLLNSNEDSGIQIPSLQVEAASTNNIHDRRLAITR